jgi:hypothetical protein
MRKNLKGDSEGAVNEMRENSRVSWRPREEHASRG